MRALLALAVLTLAGCKGAPCAELKDACACRERQDCALVTEACWCPSECDPAIACVCGGGKFLHCDPKP